MHNLRNIVCATYNFNAVCLCKSETLAVTRRREDRAGEFWKKPSSFGLMRQKGKGGRRTLLIEVVFNVHSSSNLTKCCM